MNPMVDVVYRIHTYEISRELTVRGDGVEGGGGEEETREERKDESGEWKKSRVGLEEERTVAGGSCSSVLLLDWLRCYCLGCQERDGERDQQMEKEQEQ